MKSILSLRFQAGLFSFLAITFLLIQAGFTTPVLATSQTSVQSAPFTTCVDVTEIPQAECEALVALYNSTNGAGWSTNTDWLATNTPCSWYGVECGEGYPHHIIRLNLGNNQLNGSIPTELGNLAQLLSLSLSQNQLSGSIPVELGNLAQLQNLTLWENQLTGNIPAELGNLTQLEYVPLCDNQLTGNIPTELGNLTHLTGLCLSDNQLSGSIPAQLGNLTQLTTFKLENNQLSGSIPLELGNLTLLQKLSLNDNQLTGNIPVELGNLMQLKELNFRGNQLSGSIPTQLGNLTQLTFLGLDLNQLSGSIPPELGNLTQLTFLALAGNQLTGSIPAELGNLTQLTWLGLCDNQLSGSIPAALGNLTQLKHLWLQGNQLTGSLPAELGDLTQLTVLWLQGNQLSGEFPATITNLVNLTDFKFDCWLTSSDPAVIAFLDGVVPGWQANQCDWPNIGADTSKDEVQASGWPNGTLLTMTIDGSGPFTATAGPAHWNPDQIVAVFELRGKFDLQPGQLITVTDNGNPAVVRTYTPTNLTITGFNASANTMSGTAAPGAEVGARFRISGSWVTRYATADENGDWSVDYSGIGVVLGSTSIYANEYDANGNQTMFSWRNPIFWVWPKNLAFVETLNWPLGVELTLTVDNPETSQNPDYGPFTQITGMDPWSHNQTYARFSLPFDIPPGYVVIITDGVMTRTHIVTSLEVTDVNPDTNIVTGVAAPYSLIEIDEPDFQEVTADGNGNWSTDFSGIYDIVPDTFVEAMQSDDDGDLTLAGKYGIDPTFSARLLWNEVNGYEWTLGDDVTVSIDDPDIGDLDYAPHTETVIMDPNGSGQTYVQFILDGFDLQPGQIVTMTDGIITKTHTVTDLVVTGVDPATDTVWGTGAPGSLITSSRCFSSIPDDCAMRNTTVQLDGTWQMDFSVPCGPSPAEQNLWDIVPGTWGDASQPDEDTDSTSYPWYVLAPRINALFHPYGYDEIVARDWPIGTILTLEIDDPATPASPDHTDTQVSTLRDDSPFLTQAKFKLWPPYDYLKAGDLVTVSSGGITRTHTVFDVVVTSVDIEADVISGTAGPGISQVQAKMSTPNISRWEDVVDGHWSADFSIPGDQPNETATCDIMAGDVMACDGGNAIVYEGDGDYTSAHWDIPIPSIQVEPDQGWIDVFNWYSDVLITLTVDDDTDPANGYIYQTAQLTSPPTRPYLSVGGVTFNVEQDDPTVDLLPEQYVTITDGITTKTTQIKAVTFDTINEIDDTAGGTGPADSSARVYITTSTGDLSLDIVIGPDGHWLAGFGADDQDIQTVQEASIYVYDEDFDEVNNGDEDATVAFWHAPSNQPPVADAGGPYSGSEGAFITLDASGSTDPDNNMASYQWDLDGDGYYDDATGIQPNVTFPDNRVFTIGLQVTDTFNLSSTDTTQVTVSNVIPTVTIQQSSVSNLGVFTGSGSFTDPGADTWTATVNYGDNTGTKNLALNPDKTFALSHTYVHNGTYTAKVCVTDDDGGKGCAQTQVKVAINRPPIAEADGPYFGNEGSNITLDASHSTDPERNIVRYEWDLDNDGQFDDAAGKRPKFKALDNGVFTVRVRVTDAGGLSSVDSSTVTVKNLPPVIRSLSFNSPVRVGSQVNARATFKDAGVNDTFTAIWKWGDGKTSTGTVSGNRVGGSHTYTKPGVYLVTITVMDKDGGVGQAYKLVIVLPKR